MTFHLLTSRRQTFNRSARKGLSKAQLWPYALKSKHPHPDSLALSGFHHTAGLATRCFECELEVDDWAEGEDVNERHLAGSPGCASAVFAALVEQWQRGLGDKRTWTWGDRGRDWPTGTRLAELRRKSFELGWPKHGLKGVPTPDEVSSPRVC